MGWSWSWLAALRTQLPTSLGLTSYKRSFVCHGAVGLGCDHQTEFNHSQAQCLLRNMQFHAARPWSWVPSALMGSGATGPGWFWTVVWDEPQLGPPSHIPPMPILKWTETVGNIAGWAKGFSLRCQGMFQRVVQSFTCLRQKWENE